MALYLEQYLDKLQGLPGDLAKNLKKLRDLDMKSQQSLCGIDRKIKGYFGGKAGASGGSPVRTLDQQRKRRYDEIKASITSAKKMSEDKVKLANDTYEMVDKHIRKLDSDLSRFELDLKRKLLETKQGGVSSLSANEDDSGGETTNRKGASSSKKKALKRTANNDSDTGMKKKRRKKGTDVEDAIEETSPTRLLNAAEAEHLASLSGAALFQQLAGGGADAIVDMPVDPNEPTYCLCHQVSFGEMVGCDNPECLIEWFHFGCVGLKAKPKGKWFCQRCTEERKKK